MRTRTEAYARLGGTTVVQQQAPPGGALPEDDHVRRSTATLPGGMVAACRCPGKSAVWPVLNSGWRNTALREPQIVVEVAPRHQQKHGLPSTISLRLEGPPFAFLLRLALTNPRGDEVRSYHDSLGPFVLTAFFMMIFLLTMIYHQTPTPMTPPNPGHGVDIIASGAAHSSASEAPHTSGKGH